MSAERQVVEDLEPGALFAVEKISGHFKQEAMGDHDPYGNIFFKWTFEHKGDPIQVHLLQTLNGGWGLAVADFGHDGVHAREFRKKNKGFMKYAKKIVCQETGSDVGILY